MQRKVDGLEYATQICVLIPYLHSLTQENAVDLHGRWKIYRSCQKYVSLSLHYLPSTGRLMLHVSLVTSLKPRLRTALTTQNTIENNCTVSQVQNTTALQPNIFLTGIHRLLVTDNRRPTFPTANTLPMSTTNKLQISPKSNVP